MIPPGIYRRDRKCDFKRNRNGGPATRLCSVWWDAQVSHSDIGCLSASAFRPNYVPRPPTPLFVRPNNRLDISLFIFFTAS